MRMSGSGAREGFGSPPFDPASGDQPETGETPGTASAPDGASAVGTDLPQVGVTGDADGAEVPGQGGKTAGKHSAKGRRSLWRELPVLVVIAVVLALVIKTFVVQPFYIPSGSMQNTLEIGDRVLVNKVVYHLRGISRGDIVVFNGEGSWDPEPVTSSNPVSKLVGGLENLVGISHGDDYIKRVIGLPGDHVACCNAEGKITVNGVPLSETSYLYPGNAPSATRFNITVPPGRLWVMGDHRAISYDSRGHIGDPGGGTIPENQVVGRAFVVIWPPSQWGFLNIPATFEQPKLTASAAAAGGSSKALATAMDNGVPLQTGGSTLPLAFGFVGAVPLTLFQRSARRRLVRRRRTRRARHE
jgi:signal peptidase I